VEQHLFQIICTYGMHLFWGLQVQNEKGRRAERERGQHNKETIIQNTREVWSSTCVRYFVLMKGGGEERQRIGEMEKGRQSLLLIFCCLVLIIICVVFTLLRQKISLDKSIHLVYFALSFIQFCTMLNYWQSAQPILKTQFFVTLRLLCARHEPPP
jgi:hypothetical protein